MLYDTWGLSSLSGKIHGRAAFSTNTQPYHIIIDVILFFSPFYWKREIKHSEADCCLYRM